MGDVKRVWALLVGAFAGLAALVGFSSSDDAGAGGGGGGGEPPPPPPPGGPTKDPRPPTRDAFGVFYGRGSDAPTWPLQGDRRDHKAKTASGVFVWARGKVTADFGDSRDGGARHHAGEDLRAPPGSVVVATERGTIIGIDDDWGAAAAHTGATYVRFDTGLVANFGEVARGSTRALGLNVGSVVERGQPLGTIGATDMLHFELYTDGTKHSAQWPDSGPPPPNLLDPTEYLRLAARSVP